MTITPAAIAVALPVDVTSPVKFALVVTVPAVKFEAVPLIFVPTNADGVPKFGVVNVSPASVNVALANFEPRIEVLNTNIQTRPDDNEVFITVTGRVKSTNEIIDIATTIERLR